MHLWCDEVHLWCDEVHLWCDEVHLWCDEVHLWCDEVHDYGSIAGIESGPTLPLILNPTSHHQGLPLTESDPVSAPLIQPRYPKRLRRCVMALQRTEPVWMSRGAG